MTSASSTAKPSRRSGSAEARRGADGAVDVGDGLAAAADQVVVVVPDARLVARGGAGRLDAADQSGSGQRVQHLVDRGGRDRTDLLARGHGDLVGGRVRMPDDGGQHRDPRRGRPQPAGAQHPQRIGRCQVGGHRLS